MRQAVVVVDAMDEKAAASYRKYGFTSILDANHRLFPHRKTVQLHPTCPQAYIASGLSMPSQLSAPISSRSATAAVASRNVLRVGSSSVRMWCLW